MAETGSAALARRDRFFPAVMIIGLVVLVAIASFFENDRRGLLRWERPTAFAAGDVQELPDSYDIIYLGYNRPSDRGYLTSRNAHPRIGARRTIPGRVGGVGNASGGGAPPGQANPTLTQDLPAGAGTAGNNLANTPLASSGGDGGQGPTPFTPGDLGGSGPTAPVIIPLPQSDGPTPPIDGGPPPVVPAVPEPTAWLLMILGVGILARALRSHTRSIRNARAT
jgi:hypothetical protein